MVIREILTSPTLPMLHQRPRVSNTNRDHSGKLRAERYASSDPTSDMHWTHATEQVHHFFSEASRLRRCKPYPKTDVNKNKPSTCARWKALHGLGTQRKTMPNNTSIATIPAVTQNTFQPKKVLSPS